LTTEITLHLEHLHRLDLSPIESTISPWLKQETIASQEQQLQFKIDYPRDPTDPRELSEIPEIRLYFVRLNAHYPWMPFLLDWKAGELYRYAAMLVPHQFHKTEGIIYNPEALEIFVMEKVFVLANWLQSQGISHKSRIKSMAELLGYELDDGFFELL